MSYLDRLTPDLRRELVFMVRRSGRSHRIHKMAYRGLYTIKVRRSQCWIPLGFDREVVSIEQIQDFTEKLLHHADPGVMQIEPGRILSYDSETDQLIYHRSERSTLKLPLSPQLLDALRGVHFTV